MAAPIIGRYCGRKLPNGDGHFMSTTNALYLWFHSQSAFPNNSFTLQWESVVPVCGGRMTVQNHGTLQWPQGDRRQAHWDCKWQLQTEPGRRLQFTFVTLRLPMSEPHCPKHYVQLTDGIDEERGTVMAKHCGIALHSSSPLTTSGSGATLYFHSEGDDDDHDDDQGSSEVSFTIRYTVVEAHCGGIYRQPVGTITTSTHDEDDQPQGGLVCEYRISLPIGTRVEIRFVKLDDHGSCTTDVQLELFDGPSTADPILGRFCADQPPPDRLTSTANELLVRYRRTVPSDAGFRLSYAMRCGGTFTNPDQPLISPGYPSLYPGRLQCDYVIRAPLGSIITFDFEDLDLGADDTGDCIYGYVLLYDGLSQSNRSPRVVGCKRSMHTQIRSTRNVVLLRYVYHGVRSEGRGFKGWFRSLDVGCGGVLTDDQDPIIHAQPPIGAMNRYQRNARCEWILTAPVGHTILLSWNSFALEPPVAGRCLQQYVEVYATQTGDKLAGRYCGSEQPPTMNSEGELLTVRFITDTTVPPNESFSFKFAFIATEQCKCTCGGTYSGANGIIQSPGWPHPYAPNRNCVWTIDAPKGLQIRLLVRTFDVEHQDSGCRFDGLTIRNGGTDQSPLLGTFCGVYAGELFNGTISSGHQLYLHFFSDGTGSGRGFHLEWDASTTGCGGVLSAPSGAIISPNYPLAYGHNGSCSWRIVTSQGSTIRLQLTDLYLADSDPCQHDYLDVYDGNNAGIGHRLGRYCGRISPGELPAQQTTTNRAYLRLQSTDTNQGAGGFRLEYALVCRHNITAGWHGALESPGFPDPYPPGLDCHWTIVVPHGNRIRLEFTLFRIDSLFGEPTSSTASQHCPHDYLEIRQPVRRRYCTAPPRAFVSLGSTVELLFHSASDARTGTERYGFQLEWSIEGCGGLLTTQRTPGVAQHLRSPGYPDSYPRNTECLWQIVTVPGREILFSFEELRIRPNAGCHSDGVMIANDAHFRDPITTICHQRTEAPLEFISTGHQMYIKFWSSDSTAASRGFRAKFLDPCGGEYILRRGVISSPNYPAPYPANATCLWLIQTELAHTLRLTIEALAIEPSDNCTNDALQVYDGAVPTSEHRLLLACGTREPNEISVSTSQNALLITFRSNDDPYRYRGFRASYVTNCGAQIVVKQPGNVSLDTAHMLAETNECAWILTAPQETDRITLSFVRLSIGNVTLEVLEQDAFSSGGAVRYTGSGYHLPPAIVSTGNALTVQIRSTNHSLTELDDLSVEFTYTTLENACGGRLDALTGTFASPNYPNSYPAGVECIWQMSASPGNRISLRITHLDIVPIDGCNGDYLEVRESDATGRLLGDFCGNVTQLPAPNNLTAVPAFWIKFRTSGPTVASGFLAQYSYESLVELDGSDGLITSPLYPQSYAALRSASWRVSVPSGSVVAISFNKFTIDHSSDLPDMCDGSLVIYDGSDDEAPVLLTACGYVPPDPLASSTNVVYILLDHSNARGSSLFSLQWHQQVVSTEVVPAPSTDTDAEQRPCGNSQLIVLDGVGAAYNFSSPGFPYGYAPNLSCSWIFQSAILAYRPVLQLLVVDLEETSACLADYIEVEGSFDLAKWVTLERVCRYEGYSQANATSLSAPYLRVSFRTDLYNNRTGFAAMVRLACGRHLTAGEGVLELDRRAGSCGCNWTVAVRMGREIEFEFERLNLTDGSVTIWDGIHDGASLIGRYRGSGELPALQHTTFNLARVYYQPSTAGRSSNTIEFRLLYREVSRECSSQVVLDRHFNTTHRQTPNYPSAPPPYLDCVWQILTEAGQLLRLDLPDTALFSMKDCGQTYLQVLDGLTERAPELLHTCRSFPTRQIYTTTNGMRLRYFSEHPNRTIALRVQVSLAACGRTSRSMSGSVSSENYPVPGGYPVPAECEYYIYPHSLLAPRLTFTDLHLPGIPANGCADSDSVRLYGISESPNGTERIPLGTYCGTAVPPPIDSPVHDVLVVFRTLHRPGTSAYRGFRLEYRTDKATCAHRINAPSGEVASPGYDTNRSPRGHCVWRITVPAGRRVKIEFLDLDPALARSRDFLQLLWFYDGHSGSHIPHWDHVLIPYKMPTGGGGLPAPIYTSSNELMIRFQQLRHDSDRTAFKVRFSSNETTLCAGDLNGLAGTFETPANGSTLVCSYRRTDRTLALPGHSPNGGTLALTFRELEASRSGKNCIRVVVAGKHLLRKLCSSSSSRSSTSNVTILSPYADTAAELQLSNVPAAGFKLDYRVYGCGGRYAGASISNISIGNSSSSDDTQARCAWQVLYPEGTLVELSVARFDLRLPCDREYLDVYNGPLATSPRIGRYCRDNPLAETIATNRHELYVEYHATGSGGSGTGSVELLLAGIPYGCGGTLHTGTPTFGAPLNAGNSSSSSNKRYPPNVECVWLLQAPPGHHVGVQFVGRFSIEKSPGCTKDYLELYDQRVRGGDWSSLGRVCGKVLPPVFNSTGQTLKVVFRTDNDTESDGFTIRWNANCGGVFYAGQEPQQIVSPHYPQPYWPDQRCSYTIVASPNATDRHIELRFGRFELAEALLAAQSTCQPTADSVQLYRRDERSTDPNAWQLAGTYCGRVSPVAPFRALDRARVVFRSDLSQEAAGFTFEYRLGACGGNVTGSQRIESPPGRLPDGAASNRSPLHCQWFIAIPAGQKVTVRFERFELRHSPDCREAAIEVYRGLERIGQNRLVKLCGNLTGHAPVVPISGSHGLISYRVDQQQQQQSSSSSMVALILYGPDCDRSITLDERSPRYELSVQGKDAVTQDCHYTFHAPTGYTVLVSFGKPFHLETSRNSTATESPCSDDFVALHDGLSALSPLIGRYCGTQGPPAQHSSGPWLHLRYVTDSALRQGMRLEASVTMEPSLCGTVEHDLATGVDVIVSTPLATTANDDRTVQRCGWVFRAAPDHQIELHFLKFDLGGTDDQAGNCENYIGIRDATGVRYPTTYHKYCGGSTYHHVPYISLTNEVFVQFQRESSVVSGGAVLSVRQSGACALHYTALQGRILRTVPVRGQQPCTITITVPGNYTIAVYFNHFHLVQVACEGHAVRVYEGTSERPDRLIAQYCGAVTPHPIFSTGQGLHFVLPATEAANASLLLDATYVASSEGPGCGGELYSYGGHLTSPHYPNKVHGKEMSCWWSLTVPDNLVIAVHFDLVDLGSECRTDFLELIQNVAQVKRGDRSRIRICSNTYLTNYVTSTNQLELSYKISPHFGGVGWRMWFMAVAPDENVIFPWTFVSSDVPDESSIRFHPATSIRGL
uniref:CUB domain-containing protein n=1 Tax=Anopheles albimanus TaxID=7167 RepID=A0A182FIN3_ANOAL